MTNLGTWVANYEEADRERNALGREYLAATGPADYVRLDEQRVTLNDSFVDLADSAVDVMRAAQDFGDTYEAFYDHGTSFSCGEIERIADLFRALGLEDTGDYIVRRHAVGDDEGDEHWDLRCEIEKEGGL